jgi:hypothetical protein
MNGEAPRAAASRKTSPLRTMRAVAWSFFGVRRAKDREQDLAGLNPVHLVIAGLMGAALLVLGLVMLVLWVVRSGVAA